MQARDVYKLLYQGVLGSEHILNAKKSKNFAQQFVQRLQAEFTSVRPQENEDLFEFIHPARSLGRLNLRPYKARGGDCSLLAHACLRTAHQPRGTLDELQDVWQLFLAAHRQGRWLGLDLADGLAFTGWLTESGFPAGHHSDLYRTTYQPAYRLVDVVEFQNMEGFSD